MIRNNNLKDFTNTQMSFLSKEVSSVKNDLQDLISNSKNNQTELNDLKSGLIL